VLKQKLHCAFPRFTAFAHAIKDGSKPTGEKGKSSSQGLERHQQAFGDIFLALGTHDLLPVAFAHVEGVDGGPFFCGDLGQRNAKGELALSDANNEYQK